MINTIKELMAIPKEELYTNQVIEVKGYHTAGDGGHKQVIWKEDSLIPDNGGTVHAPYGEAVPGRWEVLHEGVGDFRWFGIFDATVSADHALAALVHDPSIHRIEAKSSLLFQQRHTFYRSHIELDFNGHEVYTTGIELAEPNDPFAAVLGFKGRKLGMLQTLTLSQDMPELTDVYEVADASEFQAGQWWRVRVNALSGREERELDKLLMVTEIVDGTHVRFNYLLGWRLEAGRTLEYERIEPVVRAHIRNMVFHGAGDSDTTGAHPAAYEFAVECDTTGIEGHGTFWPLIMRRHCTHYEITRCKLYHPVEVNVGGAGYLAQQIHCLYGHVADCYTSNARHLNDFTGSAYCMVMNCHNDGDDLGAFVTHGQFEHDLTYIGNSGLMSFANSGPTWGESAKRITVKKHSATRFIAHRKVSDLTLEDVHVFAKEGLQDAGTIWVNADGVHMKGCTAPGGLLIRQVSSRSSRQNLIVGCSITLQPAVELVDASVAKDITFRDSYFYQVDDIKLEGRGGLYFYNTHFQGDPEAMPMCVSAPLLLMNGGSTQDTGIVAAGHGDQIICIDGGTSFKGTNAAHLFFGSRNTLGTVSWTIGSMSSIAADDKTSHFRLEAGRNNYKVIGAEFTGGKLHLSPEAFGNGAYLMHSNCVERGVNRELMPPQSEHVQYSQGNMIVSK